MLNGMNAHAMSLFNGMQIQRNTPARYYHTKGWDSIEDAWANGYQKVAAVMAGGTGKTYLAGEMIARRVERGERSLMVAHSQGLVLQFKDSLEKHYNIHAGLEMNKFRSSDEMVVCGTFQSLMTRLPKWEPDYFSFCVADEAHRVLADGVQQVLNYFPEAKKLGLTATFYRGDMKDLMRYFDFKAIDYPWHQATREGFLCDFDWAHIPIHIRIEAKSKTGDFTAEECGHAIEPYLEGCCEEFARLCQGRCSMAFLPLVHTSKKAAAIFQGLGIKAQHVDGTMTEKERKAAKLGLLRGEYQLACNSMLWSEGEDFPPLSAVLCLRPTRSRTLFEQIVYRLTRLFDPTKDGVDGTIWPKKTRGVFADPLFLSDKHNLLKRPTCLLATSEEDEKALEEKMDKGMSLLEAHQSVTFEREESLAKELERLSKRKAKLAPAMEVFAGSGDLEGFNYEPMARWQRDKITPGQEAILRSEGIDLESVKDKGHGFLIIEAIKQRRLSGLANTRLAHEALQSGMTDALTRGREDVVEYLSAIKRGENPYADIPPI